jgi:hypothetical protein
MSDEDFPFLLYDDDDDDDDSTPFDDEQDDDDITILDEEPFMLPLDENDEDEIEAEVAEEDNPSGWAYPPPRREYVAPRIRHYYKWGKGQGTISLCGVYTWPEGVPFESDGGDRFEWGDCLDCFIGLINMET